MRVLHCNNDNKNMGGAYLIEHRLEPYMRKLGYIYDYITMDEFIVTGDSEIDPLVGAKTYSARLRKNRFIGHFKYYRYIKQILKENSYQIVHIDIDSSWKALMYAIPAKKTKAKVIVHSHSTGIDGGYKKLKLILHLLTKYILTYYTDQYVGCSEEANQWIAPRSKWKEAKIIKNGISERDYFFSKQLRIQARTELNLCDDDFLIGNVARINDNKNQKFLIEILSKILSRGIEAKLLLVGPYTEKTYNDLIKTICKYKLEDRVLFTGETKKVNYFLNAMDYFVLPSLFEGFSLAVVEAQAVGLRCLISSTIPSAAIETDLVSQKALNEGVDKWADHIILDLQKTKISDNSLKTIYSLENMANDMSSLYEEVLYD